MIMKGGERIRSCLCQHYTLMKIYYNGHYTTNPVLFFFSRVHSKDESVFGSFSSQFWNLTYSQKAVCFLNLPLH